jgi:fructokinase
MLSVIGEALIDLVRDDDGEPAGAGGSRSFRAHPGGSPYNVAIGLARLGQPTLLQARFSGDAFGQQLRAHAGAQGVDLSAAVSAAEASTLAVVGLDAARNATYDFYVNGTADWQWSAAELALAPPDVSWIHTGSLASWTEPGASVIGSFLRDRQTLSSPPVISFDPNIRPLLTPDHGWAVAAVERLVGLADVVKASAEDLDWLYPGTQIAEVLRAWRALGADLAVVTDGSSGAHAITRDGTVLFSAARAIEVVDTVGAGDAFMAGLINAIVRRGLVVATAEADQLQPVLDEAILVAALTCQRAGADPPTGAELAAAWDARPTTAGSTAQPTG